ncbi:MAG: lipoyl(octanoyl) transferase LipB [Chloroflexota bacterium]
MMLPKQLSQDGLEIEWAGCVPYLTAWEWQKTLVKERAGQDLPHKLLLLEHPPVYTLGRRGRLENLLLNEAQLAAQGIELHRVDRGGDISYHGPGQLVGYPILNLKRLFQARGLARPDLHLYLRQLEEVVIQTVAEFGIEGWRYEGYTGVWVKTAVGPQKIAAIGLKVSGKGISSHGFALNVDPNLDHFAGIIACGIREHGVTSLAQLLGQTVTVAEVIRPLIRAFAAVFEVETVLVSPSLSPYNQPQRTADDGQRMMDGK